MFYAYIVLTALLTWVLASNLLRERSLVTRISYALMLIPFVLRTVVVK